jgi:tetratricopeptide (TPR) repeat protein
MPGESMRAVSGQEEQARVIRAEKQRRESATGVGLARPPLSGRGPRIALMCVALLALLGAASLSLWQEMRPAPRSTTTTVIEDAAETRLRQAVEARPGDVAARLALGGYLEQQARPFEAMWEYAGTRHLAAAHPALPGRMAAVLREGEAIDQAAAPLVEALRARPRDMALRRQLAELRLAMGEPGMARQVMEAHRELVWQHSGSAITLGRARQAAGDVAAATAAYQRAMALDPKSGDAYYRLGRLYLQQGESDRARDAFFHAMFLQQSNPDYPFYAGMAYLQQAGTGDAERALRFFKDTLVLNSRYAPAHYQSGRALERMGRRSAALSRYSLALIADGSLAEATQALGRGLATVGNAADAHRYLGKYYDLIDRPAAAVAEFRRMEAAAPQSVDPALLIGQVYMRTRQSPRAVAVTEAALKRHPDDPQLLERLTVLKINLGDWAAARRFLERWMQAEPKSSRPYWLMGRCELGDQKYQEAITWLEKAVAREPRNPHYLGYLGAALLKQDAAASRERAAQVLAEAVALAPDEAEYRELYGQALQRLGQDEPARRQFLRALDADPSRIGAYLSVSQTARRLNQPGSAAYFAAMVRSVQARESEETRLWTRVWRRPAEAASRLELARFLCRTGQLDRARNQLEEAVTLQPTSAEARALLATVQRCKDVR